MIPDDHALMLFRFGEKHWIEKLIQGELSFSCTGAFINQAAKTGNEVQGDKFEGIFARLEKDDIRIEKMRQLLGRDLEEIEYAPYTLLRRRSSKMKPIFCFYGYTASDALSDGKIGQIGFKTIRHDFNPKMYSGFADGLRTCNAVSNPHRFTLVIIQPKPFVDRVKISMFNEDRGFTMKRVNYSLFKLETFFIEPTTAYDELFYKFPQYEYQHETRICLQDKKFSNIFERCSINVGAFLADDFKMCHEEVYFQFNAIIEERK